MHSKLLSTIAAIGFVTVLTGCQQQPAPLPPANPVPFVGEGQSCGGNMMNAPQCKTGFHCAPTPGSTAPFGDIGGTCVAD